MLSLYESDVRKCRLEKSLDFGSLGDLSFRVQQCQGNEALRYLNGITTIKLVNNMFLIQLIHLSHYVLDQVALSFEFALTCDEPLIAIIRFRMILGKRIDGVSLNDATQVESAGACPRQGVVRREPESFRLSKEGTG